MTDNQSPKAPTWLIILAYAFDIFTFYIIIKLASLL